MVVLMVVSLSVIPMGHGDGWRGGGVVILPRGFMRFMLPGTIDVHVK